MSEQKFCKYCGAPLAEGATFCSKCGKPVVAAAPRPHLDPRPHPEGNALGAEGKSLRRARRGKSLRRAKKGKRGGAVTL